MANRGDDGRVKFPGPDSGVGKVWMFVPGKTRLGFPHRFQANLMTPEVLIILPTGKPSHSS